MLNSALPPPSQPPPTGPPRGAGAGAGAAVGMMPPSGGPGSGLPPPPSLGASSAPQASAAGNNITLRLILSREEVTYLFGFDGTLLQQLRQQTGANIQLTDPVQTVSDQVLTLNAPLEVIMKAFSLVCRKLWDFVQNVAGPQRPLVLRLAVPISQCGPIIGKQGAKVKEIRDLTGANIQVSQDTLPNSTERCVEVSGPGESCLQCTYHICTILQDSPLRNEVMPYLPQDPNGPGYANAHPNAPDTASGSADQCQPVILCGDKAFVIDGHFARPAPAELLRKELAQTSLGQMAESRASLSAAAMGQQPTHMNPLALMQALSSTATQRSAEGAAGHVVMTSTQMSVSASLIPFIVGPSGAKMAEICRISGAQLHLEDGPSAAAAGDRIVAISGSKESILLAQFLIQANIDMAMKQGASYLSHPPPQAASHPNNGYQQQHHHHMNMTNQDMHHMQGRSQHDPRGGRGSYDNGGGGGPSYRDPRTRNSQMSHGGGAVGAMNRR